MEVISGNRCAARILARATARSVAGDKACLRPAERDNRRLAHRPAGGDVAAEAVGGATSPREVMRRVRATALAAFAHQELPFEELVETLEEERGVKPETLSKMMIWLQNAALRPIASSGHKLAFEEAIPSMLLPLVTITKFDVILMLRETGRGLMGCCVYKPHLFRATIIDRLLRDFRKVLELMLTEPERPISKIRLTVNANS